MSAGNSVGHPYCLGLLLYRVCDLPASKSQISSQNCACLSYLRGVHTGPNCAVNWCTEMRWNNSDFRLLSFALAVMRRSGKKNRELAPFQRFSGHEPFGKTGQESATLKHIIRMHFVGANLSLRTGLRQIIKGM